ncbi:response regulator [Sphingomonas nostoxanthinifaciens]|uniref:response regulator n=1 Tax=Sphingomonas nostoxanthinifaciens TaxID=2872652 RepID=UPI001CC1C6A7|nr:response regulator [Sphingomonas nostoxanthinifaciens]UAK25428.1 response regulator [Sphingomonas nostoxanthinifaciens]
MGIQARIDRPARTALSLATRVLIVEDHALLATVAADMIEDLGGTIAAVAVTVEEALAACAVGGITIALLDLDLGGHHSGPVARALVVAGIPFIVTTGAMQVPDGLGEAAVLTKPYALGDLRRALTALAD